MGICLSSICRSEKGPNVIDKNVRKRKKPSKEGAPTKSTKGDASVDPGLVPDFIDVGSVSSNGSYFDDSFRKLTKIQRLEMCCPTATDAERQRFLNAKGGDYDLAQKQLSDYLDWRHKYDVDSMVQLTQTDIYIPSKDKNTIKNFERSTDEVEWMIASTEALAWYTKDGKECETSVSTLPRLTRVVTLPGSQEEPIKTTEGNIIIQLLPAQMDPKIADEDTYTLAIAFYLERKLNRDDMEKIVVCIDMRPGDNWHNAKAGTLIPFIKNVTACLGNNFPERLAKSILFPMPKLAMTLWKVVRKFLDQNTAKKIVIIGGKSSKDAKIPQEKLERYISKEAVDQMEQMRQDAIDVKKSDTGDEPNAEAPQIMYWA